MGHGFNGVIGITVKSGGINDRVSLDLVYSLGYETYFGEFFLGNQKDLPQPGGLQDTHKGERHVEKVEPPSSYHIGTGIGILEGIGGILTKVIGNNGPHGASTQNKQDNKDGSDGNFGQGKGIAQAHHAMFIVKVGQDTEDTSGNFGQAKKENGIIVTEIRSQDHPGRKDGKNVMQDKFNAVVPNNGIVQILDLIPQKEHGYPNTFGMRRIHTLQVGSRDMRTLFAKTPEFENTPDNGTALPAHECQEQQTECVGPNVTSQDMTIDLWFHYGMPILHLQK